MTVGCGCPARVTKGQTLLRRTQLCLISCGPLRCVRGQQKFRQAFDGSEAQQVNQRHVLTALLPDVLPVSYTHLTLPTSDLVEISAVAESLKKKKAKKKNKHTRKRYKNVIK